MYKFYDREPTLSSNYADYQPLLTSPTNVLEYTNNDGTKSYTNFKGPHPAIIVTRYGYITYGTGENTSNVPWAQSFDSKTVKKVELNSYYFHKY